MATGFALPNLDAGAPVIARYKVPKLFVFWDEIPKSSYRKVSRKLIREELVRRGDLPARDERNPGP